MVAARKSRRGAIIFKGAVVENSVGAMTVECRDSTVSIGSSSWPVMSLT